MLFRHNGAAEVAADAEPHNMCLRSRAQPACLTCIMSGGQGVVPAWQREYLVALACSVQGSVILMFEECTSCQVSTSKPQQGEKHATDARDHALTLQTSQSMLYGKSLNITASMTPGLWRTSHLQLAASQSPPA